MTKNSKNITLPNQITFLVEAMNCDDENAARLLVSRAMETIFPHKSWQEKRWSNADLDAVISLIRGINPKDTIEAILAAQFVSLHLKGIAVMSQDNYHIMGQAMMMVRLSHQALNILQHYRGKSQTINVNYNVLNQGNAILNTVIQEGVNIKKKE